MLCYVQALETNTVLGKDVQFPWTKELVTWSSSLPAFHIRGRVWKEESKYPGLVALSNCLFCGSRVYSLPHLFTRSSPSVGEYARILALDELSF